MKPSKILNSIIQLHAAFCSFPNQKIDHRIHQPNLKLSILNFNDSQIQFVEKKNNRKEINKTFKTWFNGFLGQKLVVGSGEEVTRQYLAEPAKRHYEAGNRFYGKPSKILQKDYCHHYLHFSTFIMVFPITQLIVCNFWMVP